MSWNQGENPVRFIRCSKITASPVKFIRFPEIKWVLSDLQDVLKSGWKSYQIYKMSWNHCGSCQVYTATKILLEMKNSSNLLCCLCQRGTTSYFSVDTRRSIGHVLLWAHLLVFLPPDLCDLYGPSRAPSLLNQVARGGRSWGCSINNHWSVCRPPWQAAGSHTKTYWGECCYCALLLFQHSPGTLWSDCLLGCIVHARIHRRHWFLHNAATANCLLLHWLSGRQTLVLSTLVDPPITSANDCCEG